MMVIYAKERNPIMCKHDAPSTDDLLVRALVDYLDDKISMETFLRELLDRARCNDPSLSVEDCLRKLVDNYNALMGKPSC